MLKKISIVILLVTLICTTASAKEVAGISIPEKFQIIDKELILNGSGIRKKFFIKVYVGSLYTETKINSIDELYMDNFNGVIKMSILYKKIEAKKLKSAYIEGFEANTPSYINEIALKDFINAFNFDAKRGDIIDIIFTNGDTVTVKFNNAEKIVITSEKLVRAVLKVYFGKKPADKGMKKGMLNK